MNRKNYWQGGGYNVAFLGKDKYWWWGENSLWADFCQWIGKPEWIIYRDKPRPPEPTEPECVDVKICKKCGNRAVGKCPINIVAWEKRLETEVIPNCIPKKCCNKPKPPSPAPVPIKNYHFDGLGIFLDALAHGEEALPRIEAVIAKAASYGVSALSYFSYLHTGRHEHKHLNWKTPWVRVGDKFQLLDVPFGDSWYYNLHKEFLKILNRYNIKPIPHGEMWNYTRVPYEKNINGVHGFLDTKALHYQGIHARRLTWQAKSICGETGFKPVNEAAHSGSDRIGHLLANWHREIFFSIKDRVELKNLIIDVSHSEFTAAELVYHGTGLRRIAMPPYKPQDYRENCIKCGRPWDNIKKYNRIITFEQHRCSIIDDLHNDVKTGEDRLYEFLRSASRHIKFSEDGSQNPKAEIVPFPGEHWRLGSFNQVYEMVKHGFSECKKKGKDFYWGIFPMESLIDHPWGKEEYYDIDTINWARFEAAQNAFNEIGGG